MGSFSRVFHKISSAYGWSDKRILNLTIRRMRQISAEIDQSAWLEKFHQRQLIAWQTRMICSWLVKLTPDMTPDMAKKLLEEAASISLDGNQGSRVVSPPEESKITRRDFYDMSDDEIEQHLGVADNPAGSFEKLMGGFRGG